jgi:hypothetical protein
MLNSTVTYQMIYDIHLLCGKIYKNYLNTIEVLNVDFLNNTLNRTELLKYKYKFNIHDEVIELNILNLFNDLCYMLNINYIHLNVSQTINEILKESNNRNYKGTLPNLNFYIDM